VIQTISRLPYDDSLRRKTDLPTSFVIINVGSILHTKTESGVVNSLTALVKISFTLPKHWVMNQESRMSASSSQMPDVIQSPFECVYYLVVDFLP
jgi:hypothetical protein